MQNCEKTATSAVTKNHTPSEEDVGKSAEEKKSAAVMDKIKLDGEIRDKRQRCETSLQVERLRTEEDIRRTEEQISLIQKYVESLKAWCAVGTL